jgi:hypothetical protein
MINHRDSGERAGRMAQLTVIAGLDVFECFWGRRNKTTLNMAGCAILGSSLENAVDMTALAGKHIMGPCQREPCCEMVKFAFLFFSQRCVNTKHTDDRNDDKVTDCVFYMTHLFIHDDVLKRLHNMTPLTKIAELTVMHIILLMTRQAACIQENFCVHPRLMAGFTFQPCMTAFQLVSGLSVMIENPEFPAIGVMASLTLAP